MGNQRITDLTKVNNFSGDGDLIPIVINTGTVPVNASITKANFIAALNSGSFVTLDTAQTITGTKTFDIGNTDTKIVVNNLTETAKGIVINNDGGADVSQETVGLDINTTGYGYGLRVRNDDIGFGIYGEDNGNSAGIAGVSNGIGSALYGRADGGGKALFLTGDGSGDRIVVQNTSLQTVYTLDKDGNVNANSFVGDGNGLTNLNALELDNTTPFTPTADYEPATKKYVDDNAGSGGGNTNKEFTFGRRIDFNSDGRWVGHYNSEDGAQVLNWNRGTGTDASIPNYYGFILLEPNSVLKKLVLSALYDSVYTGIDIQIWGAEANTTTITKLYSGTFSPVLPDTSLQSYDRYELDMGDISLTNSHRLFVAVRPQQDTLATRTVRGQIKLIWEES